MAVPLPADVRTEGRTRRRKEDKPKRHVEDTPKHDKAKEKEKKGRKKKAERNKKTGKRRLPVAGSGTTQRTTQAAAFGRQFREAQRQAAQDYCAGRA